MPLIREAQTLEVLLEDSVTKVQAVLLYGVLPEYDIITRSVRIANGGPDRIYVNKAASACLDFLDGEYDMISFYGRHAMERNFQRTPVHHGKQAVRSEQRRFQPSVQSCGDPGEAQYGRESPEGVTAWCLSTAGILNVRSRRTSLIRPGPSWGFRRHFSAIRWMKERPSCDPGDGADLFGSGIREAVQESPPVLPQTSVQGQIPGSGASPSW